MFSSKELKLRQPRQKAVGNSKCSIGKLCVSEYRLSNVFGKLMPHASCLMPCYCIDFEKKLSAPAE